MAEIEYKGLSISGTKWLIIFPLIGTILGSLYGGFELWKRYEDMEQTISQYKAPDMSGCDKRKVIITTDTRWSDKLTKVDSQIEALETKIDKKITKALTNPLAAMSKTK